MGAKLLSLQAKWRAYLVPLPVFTSYFTSLHRSLIHNQESAKGVAGDDESNFISPSPESSHLGGGGSAEHQPAQPPVTHLSTESTEENQNSKNIENSSKKQPLSETLKAKPAVGIFRQFRFGPGKRKASTNKTPEDIRRSDLKFIQGEFKTQKMG